MMKALKASIAIGVLAFGSAAAQDSSQNNALGKVIELSAHRALFSALEDDPHLAPFTTDGCSGGLSESWTLVADWFPEFAEVHEDIPPWESCCVTHDHAYHNIAGASSPEDSFSERLMADQVLRGCVKATGQERRSEISQLYDVSPAQVDAAYDAIAGAMYLAVRFGGGPCSGLPWRWGYGYSQCSVFTTSIKTE